jgi:hypothetical protein
VGGSSPSHETSTIVKLLVNVIRGPGSIQIRSLCFNTCQLVTHGSIVYAFLSPSSQWHNKAATDELVHPEICLAYPTTDFCGAVSPRSVE